MTDNELLLAISGMLDEKLKPIDNRTKRLELMLENEVVPRLQNIESCYTSTYHRYINSSEGIEAAMNDVELLKQVVREHSTKLQKIS